MVGIKCNLKARAEQHEAECRRFDAEFAARLEDVENVVPNLEPGAADGVRGIAYNEIVGETLGTGKQGEESKAYKAGHNGVDYAELMYNHYEGG